MTKQNETKAPTPKEVMDAEKAQESVVKEKQTLKQEEVTIEPVGPGEVPEQVKAQADEKAKKKEEEAKKKEEAKVDPKVKKARQADANKKVKEAEAKKKTKFEVLTNLKLKGKRVERGETVVYPHDDFMEELIEKGLIKLIK